VPEVTLGPKSKSVLIQRKWSTPLFCNDGVTIAKEFDLSDPEENLGARRLRQAAEKTAKRRQRLQVNPPTSDAGGSQRDMLHCHAAAAIE
jgi:hypothetical protein